MKTEIVTITPAHAEHYLSNNKGNRRIVKQRVLDLMSAMNRGEWKLSPQPIILSKTGRLLDGQHRLSALVMYGKPLEMSLTTGASDEIFDILDTGKHRNYADVTGMNLKEAQTITSLATTYYSKTPTHQQSHVLNELYIDETVQCASLVRGNLKILTSAMFIAGLVFMIKRFGNGEYVLDQYNHMLRFNFSELSGTSSSVFKIYNKSIIGKLSFTKAEIFTLACKFADHRKPNLKHIIYSTDKYITEFKALTQTLIDDKS